MGNRRAVAGVPLRRRCRPRAHPLRGEAQRLRPGQHRDRQGDQDPRSRRADLRPHRIRGEDGLGHVEARRTAEALPGRKQGEESARLRGRDAAGGGPAAHGGELPGRHGSGRRVDLTEIRSRLERIAESAWFAYASLLLIQTKILWGIWRYRDLSPGDTSNYFIQAHAWADHRWVDPLFSPLYTSLWGTLLSFVHDIYAATIAQRVIVVLAVTLLVLAVLR